MKVEEIQDLDGGGVMGWHLYGDVDDLDVDLFLAEQWLETPWVMETAGEDGFDIVPTYVRKVPINDPHSEYDGGYRFAYQNGPGPGASKCVRVEPAHLWPHWCHNHIWERASTGIPLERVKDPVWPFVHVRIASPERRARMKHRGGGPMDGEACVYLCRECARTFSEREDLARQEHMLAYYESQPDEHNARYAELCRARIAELKARAT